MAALDLSRVVIRRDTPDVVVIPQHVVMDPVLSTSAKATYCVLSVLAMSDEPDTTAAALAKPLGASDKSVRAWVAELKARGVITVKTRRGAAPVITILDRPTSVKSTDELGKKLPMDGKKLPMTPAATEEITDVQRKILPMPTEDFTDVDAHRLPAISSSPEPEPAGGVDSRQVPPRLVSDAGGTHSTTSSGALTGSGNAGAREKSAVGIVPKLRELRARYVDAPDQSKRIGIAGETFEALFGSRPDYARIGKILREARSYDVLVRAMQTAAQRDPTDDPLGLVQVIVTNSRRTSFGGGDHRRAGAPVGVRQSASDDESDEYYLSGPAAQRAARNVQGAD